MNATRERGVHCRLRHRRRASSPPNTRDNLRAVTPCLLPFEILRTRAPARRVTSRTDKFIALGRTSACPPFIATASTPVAVSRGRLRSLRLPQDDDARQRNGKTTEQERRVPWMYSGHRSGTPAIISTARSTSATKASAV